MAVKELKTKAEFDQALKDAGDKLVVVDFFATWCGPCRMISPKVEAMATEFAGQMIVYKVDVDVNDETSQACKISAMPTFIFYKNSEKLDEVVGASEDKIREMIKKLL